MSKIVVLGCGGWGIGIALTAYRAGNEVTLWTCFPQEAEELSLTRCNNKLLPGVTIPEGIVITTEISAVSGADAAVIAVPSFAVRETAEKLRNIDFGIIINAAKGLDSATGNRLSEVIEESCPDHKIVVLSGPTHAEEVARQVPTTVVAASSDSRSATYVQQMLGTEDFRVYTNSDVIGTELGGAFKNVIAVAAGIIDGLGCGDNTKAALITRGISEITGLAVALGAKSTTFLGLAGIGDLVVTCTSQHSRNHRYGELVGWGTAPDKALSEVGTVEGYYAAAAAVKLAKKAGVEMPIIEQCYEIMYNGADCRKALTVLMNRPYRAESDFDDGR